MTVLGISLAKDVSQTQADNLQHPSTALLLEQAAGLPENPAPWTVVPTDAGDWIAAGRTQGEPARWWLATAASTETDNLPQTDHAAWQVADIAAGLPWVQAAIQDVFIPQTLNLDLIDGVSFTKGCYPGQEVVARSHYRGTVKRRMAGGLIASAADVNPDTLAATDTFDARRDRKSTRLNSSH